MLTPYGSERTGSRDTAAPAGSWVDSGYSRVTVPRSLPVVRPLGTWEDEYVRRCAAKTDTK